LSQPHSYEHLGLILGLKGGSLRSSGLYDEVTYTSKMRPCWAQKNDRHERWTAVMLVSRIDDPMGFRDTCQIRDGYRLGTAAVDVDDSEFPVRFEAIDIAGECDDHRTVLRATNHGSVETHPIKDFHE